MANNGSEKKGGYSNLTLRGEISIPRGPYDPKWNSMQPWSLGHHHALGVVQIKTTAR